MKILAIVFNAPKEFIQGTPDLNDLAWLFTQDVTVKSSSRTRGSKGTVLLKFCIPTGHSSKDPTIPAIAYLSRPTKSHQYAWKVQILIGDEKNQADPDEFVLSEPFGSLMKDVIWKPGTNPHNWNVNLKAVFKGFFLVAYKKGQLGNLNLGPPHQVFEVELPEMFRRLLKRKHAEQEEQDRLDAEVASQAANIAMEESEDTHEGAGSGVFPTVKGERASSRSAVSMNNILSALHQQAVAANIITAPNPPSAITTMPQSSALHSAAPQFRRRSAFTDPVSNADNDESPPCNVTANNTRVRQHSVPSHHPLF